MKYQTTIETRPLPPIEIPRCEISLPMPRKWLEKINEYGINVEMIIASAVCGTHNLPARELHPYPRFMANWHYAYKKARVPARLDKSTACRAMIPIRTDILRALEVCSLQVCRSPHFLALKIIGKGIEIEEDCQLAKH